MTEVGSHEEGSASVEVHLHPHLAPMQSKMLSDGHETAHGRFLDVQGPPVHALRELASAHGSSISHLTRDELLLHLYQLSPAEQQLHHFELLEGHLPHVTGAGTDSAAMQNSGSPADSSGCSIEVQSVPSLAMFEIPSQLSSDHPLSAQGTGPTSKAPVSDMPQPEISGDGSVHSQLASPEQLHASDIQDSEGPGHRQHLTAMEQLLASLPDIDIVASPNHSEHAPDSRAKPASPTRRKKIIQEQICISAQQAHADKEAHRSEQEQPEPAQNQGMATWGGQNWKQTVKSDGSDITHKPASVLYEQRTQKQIRKEKRKGVLVPQVDSAVQACRIRISPGMAAIQPSPGYPGLHALVRAIEGVSQQPRTASTNRPEQTVRAKAHAANLAPTSRSQPEHKAAAPQHKALKPPTHFIAHLQLDLAARVLAKQPEQAQEQPPSMHQRGSLSNMLLSPRHPPKEVATGAYYSTSHTAGQQASSQDSLPQAAAAVVPQDRSAAAYFTCAPPIEHVTYPHTGGCAVQRSRVAESAAVVLSTASVPDFHVGSTQQSPQFVGPSDQQHVDLQALVCAMAASEHSAAALEQQLAAAHHRAAGTPGNPAGSFLSLLTEHQDAPIQTMPGMPISLQHPWPESNPTPPSGAQKQLVAHYIDAGAIIQGHPISVPTSNAQQTAEWAAPDVRLSSHGLSVTEDALSAALQTLTQQTQEYALGESGTPGSGRQANQAAIPRAGMRGADLQQECQLSPVMRSPAEAPTAFVSPSLFALSGSLSASPLAEDNSLSRVWHTAATKRIGSSGNSERPAKRPRSGSLGAGSPVGGVIGLASPWQTVSPAPLMSTPSARLSRATEYLYGASPEGPSTLRYGASHAQSPGQQHSVAPSSHRVDRAHGRRSASPRQKAKQQVSWVQAQCRDVAPDLELLELQQISQQLHSLLGQCGSSMQPSEQGFGAMSRSLLKLLEHLLVFPMTTEHLQHAHIITPVYACSRYPQEDVAGFASYLLSQWQSLLSSSLYLQSAGSPAAASGGFSAAASASLHTVQASAVAQLTGNALTAAAQSRQLQQQRHGSQSALPMLSAQQPRTQPGQLSREPHGFRPYGGRRARSAAPQSDQRNIMKAAMGGSMPPKALSSGARSAADLSQAGHAEAGVMPMSASSEMADGLRPQNQAWAGDMASMPGVDSFGIQATQPRQEIQPLQQLQSLPGTRPTSSVPRVSGSFIKQVQPAPAGHMLLTASPSPVNQLQPEQQAQGMTPEEIATLFPSLQEERDWHIPGMPAPYFASTSAPQQLGTFQANDQGINGMGHGMHGGGSRSAVSALTGASSAFKPFSRRASSERLTPPDQPGRPCPGGHCMQPPGVQRLQGSNNDSMCKGNHGQPHGNPLGEHGYQERAEEALPTNCDSLSGQQCMQPDSQQAAPSSKASGVDVSILEAQSASPELWPIPEPAADTACSPQQAEASEEETVISDIPRQRTGKRHRTGAAVTPCTRAISRSPASDALYPAAAAGLTGRPGGGHTERAKRRAALLAERAATLRQAAEHSAADSLVPHDSSGLDGSQGAAWGLAAMLQRGSRAKGQLSRAAASSHQVSREVAGALEDVIDAIDKAAASETHTASQLPAQSEAATQAAQGQGSSPKKEMDAAEAKKTPSAESEAAYGGAGSDVPTNGGMSIRVVWTREDEVLYKEVLRKHGRSMVHLCAAFPTKPSKAITKFFNNRKKAMGLADILTAAGHSLEII